MFFTVYIFYLFYSLNWFVFFIAPLQFSCLFPHCSFALPHPPLPQSRFKLEYGSARGSFPVAVIWQIAWCWCTIESKVIWQNHLHTARGQYMVSKSASFVCLQVATPESGNRAGIFNWHATTISEISNLFHLWHT